MASTREDESRRAARNAHDDLGAKRSNPSNAARNSTALKTQPAKSRPERNAKRTVTSVKRSADYKQQQEHRSLLQVGQAERGAQKREQKIETPSTRTRSPATSPANPSTSSRAIINDARTAHAHSSKTIYSFFNAVTQRQQSQAVDSPEKRPSPPVKTEEEDFIEDDSLDEDLAAEQPTTSLAMLHRKRKIEEVQQDANGALQGSQKFLRISREQSASSTRTPSSDVKHTDNRPWVDRFGPSSVDELSVHRKKVADVQAWLSSALNGAVKKRLLIIKGAAGTGKTSTVKLIAKRLGAGVREWHNPETWSTPSEGSNSVAVQFEEFINNSGKFGSLELSESTQSTGSSQQRESEATASGQVTLVEELPNVFMHSTSGIATMRSCIQQHLAAGVSAESGLFAAAQPNHQAKPVVVICSETLLNSSTSAMDSLTAHKLFGSEIMTHPSVSVIDFNPVAPTILTKALELVIRKEARDSGRRRAPGPAVLRHLSEIGDVRSAVSALEFICLHAADANSWSGRVAATGNSRGRKSAVNDSTALTKAELKALEVITQRESALGIFHAVGKIVYNKRQSHTETSSALPPPPLHLAQHVRTSPPGVDVDALMDELGTDIQTFTAALHENYILSCATSDPESTLDCVNGSIDLLSAADLLCSDNLGAAGMYRGISRGTSGDVLRQEEISYQVASRGLLFSLPHPVKRAAFPSTLMGAMARANDSGQSYGGRGDTHRMFFPTSLKLWRRKEETESLLTALLSKAQRGELHNIASLSGSRQTASAGTVDSWKSFGSSKFSATQQPSSAPDLGQSRPQENVNGEPSRLLLGGASAKREMLLEQLPFVPHINRTKSSGTMQSDLLRQIDRVVSVTGLPALATDEDDDQVEVARTAHATAGAPAALPIRAFRKDDPSAVPATNITQGLVLSDDDIEDD